MQAEEALSHQIDLYRKMTGEERLAIALRLHELACETTRCGIRAQRPELSRDEVDQELRRRITLGYSL